MYQQHLEKTFTYRVKLDEAAKVLSITDDSYELHWKRGADVSGGVPVPTLGAKLSRSMGRLESKSFEKVYAVNEEGQFGKVVDYSFDSGEGRRHIREPARELGWTEKAGTAQRIGHRLRPPRRGRRPRHGRRAAARAALTVRRSLRQLRLRADAKPNQVCRLPAQHQPTFGAPCWRAVAAGAAADPDGGRPCVESLAVGLSRGDGHEAVIAFEQLGFLQQPADPLADRQGSAPELGMAGRASSGLQLRMSSPRSMSWTR